MRRPRVLLDVDGVLADFLGFAIQTMYELSGKTYTRDQFAEWDLFETFDPKWKHEFFYECARPGVARTLGVCEGAKEGVGRLQEIADVYVVTAPMKNAPFWWSERVGWLDRQFDVPESRIIYTEAKYMCGGDLLVDDKPSNVKEWMGENPNGLGLLWDAPYNRLDRGLTRTASWDDVVDTVRLLKEKADHGILSKNHRRSLGSIGEAPHHL